MSTTEQLDLVAVGAHPDDVEIACGGTLAQLARLGYRVGIIDLTDGEPTPLSPGPAVRLEEARRAAEILGVQVRETMSLPNRRLFDTFETRVALARLFRRYRPHVVLGLSGKTVQASPDHYQAMLITDAAVFYARLTKWDEHFDGLPPHSVATQVNFSLAIRTLERFEGSGSFVADISDTLDIKLQAVRAYKTQFPPEKEPVLQLIEAVNRHFGQTAGFTAGELFTMNRAIGSDDFMKVASPFMLDRFGSNRNSALP